VENLKKIDDNIVDLTEISLNGSTSLKLSENQQKTRISTAPSNAHSRPASSEMRAGPGFRVNDKYKRVLANTLARLSEFETPDISDALNRMFTMDPAIRNVVNDKAMYGTALTVKVFPGDNLMVHKALDVAKPGDIIVIDTSGGSRNALVGDLIGNKAKHLGIAGFIVDGLVRDLPGLQEIGLPIYATGITAFGPLHRGPGELGHTISCGGIVVNSGDAICADGSGVVVVREEFAVETCDYLAEQTDRMASYIENVKAGNFSNEWVDRQLKQDGCIFD